MGKPKKGGKKGRQDEDFGDDDAAVDVLAGTPAEEPAAPAPAGKKGKKGKKKKDDDWDDDVAAEVAALSLGDEVANGPGEAPAHPAKQKKNKKKQKKQMDSDNEDEDDDNDIMALARGSGKAGKLGGKMSAFQMLSAEGDSEEESEEEEEEVPAPVAEKGKTQKKAAGMSAFQMLGAEDDSDTDEEEDMEEEEEEEKPQKKANEKQSAPNQKKGKGAKKKADEDEDLDAILAEIEKPKGKPEPKGKKGKGKKKNAEEEDIDAILADLDQPAEKAEGKGKKKKKGKNEAEGEEEMAAPPAEEESTGLDFSGKDLSQMTQEEIAKFLDGGDDEEEEDKKKKKKGKKGKKDDEPKSSEPTADGESLEVDGGEAEGEDGSTVKTAAQKKREKKERQKLQKQQAKTGKKVDGGEKPQEKEASPEDASPAVTPSTEKPPPTEDAAAEDGQGSEGEGDEGDDKKKKKKKKKTKEDKEKEKEDKGKKKMAKGQLKAMQEALARVKEEELRLQQEEEEQQRRAEEAQRLKEEKEQRDKEKKERDKQRKKEKIEQMKKEGRYLTAKQKEAQRRAQAMLEAMRQQGLEVPQAVHDAAAGHREESTGEVKKKRVVYDNKRKKKQQQTSGDTSGPPSEVTSPTEEHAPVTPPSPELSKESTPQESVEVKEDKAEEILDSWDAVEEVKEDWAASSDEEKEEEKPAPMETDSKTKSAEESEEESEEEEEEDGSDDEEESEDEDSEEESSSEEESDDDRTLAEKARDKALDRIEKRRKAAEANMTTDILRAPVVCVLGHVDTGKTKILDKLRRTNVQDGEAGGITQQIGATNVPQDTIKKQTVMCKEFARKELKIPGLLIIDTPGHESFSNLRSRGSSLCDIAILVVDIMHGLEPQTIESINLLKKRKTPFIVALNKIDRLFQWQPNPHGDVQNTLKKQKPNTKIEFDERVQSIIVQFAEQSLNATLSYENKNPREYISMVPTSAHSGDGMGNLIALICDLTQTMLAKRISYSDELQATTMEVKALPGLGTTIDVILVNGKIKEGDTICISGTEGPIVTQIRGLLMPQPLRELRVKGAYEHHKEVQAAQGVKIIAKDLEKALAGLPLYVAHHQDEIDILKEEVEANLGDVLSSIKLSERGVFVQASTLGSMEALLEFLRTSKIPYAGINIGPVHRKDIMKASIMLEHDPQWAVILAFDVRVEREAQEMADSMGVRIFTADIIYHLFDAFMAHREELKKQKQEEFKHIAVFPCKLRILPQYIFNSRDPIVVGVQIEAGFVKEGTPICVPSKEFLEVGRVVSVEVNHKQVPLARKGQEVCLKIDPIPGEAPKMYGRHFDHTDLLMSKISRQSIDAVKNYFREEMTKGDWQLILEMKKLFEIL